MSWCHSDRCGGTISPAEKVTPKVRSNASGRCRFFDILWHPIAWPARRRQTRLPAMGNLAHFAINADDTARARRFYEKVFDWEFASWGPPDFFQIATGEEGVYGALQKRREIVKGKPFFSFECTIAVDDVAAVAAAVQKNGGKIVMKECTIDGVGRLLFFEDTEGNIAGAMQYEA